MLLCRPPLTPPTQILTHLLSTHLSSILSCIDRLTKLESLANFLGVNRLFGSPYTYILEKQEFSEMELLPAGCIHSCLPLG